VLEKLQKAHGYTFGEFDEVWLLVAAAIPQLRAVAATFLLPLFLNSEALERDTGAEPRGSKYARAYLHIHLGGSIYEWTRARGWQKLPRPG
jgi:hypothetical protein